MPQRPPAPLGPPSAAETFIPTLWELLGEMDALDTFRSFPAWVQAFLIIGITTLVFVNVIFFRLTLVLGRDRPGTYGPRPKTSKEHPTHLLVVLGSGGHSTEMLDMLRKVPTLHAQYSHRTYVVSSGDGFSALKAAEFEQQCAEKNSGSEGGYDIVTVRRARRVHQSIYTTPFSATLCIWDCLQALRGTHREQKANAGYPDLMLTNGPGTGVCVVAASMLLLFCGFGGPRRKTVLDGEEASYASGQMRTIFVESWARVKTLSLSGRILRPFVDRFLVQWPKLAPRGDRVECLRALVA